jgi:F0F1-type ATP synthase assembly protein I
MSITGKVVGVFVGLLIFRSPWGAIIGLILGHFYDQSVVTVRRTGGGALETGKRFFTATSSRGHCRRQRARLRAEIAAARKVWRSCASWR